MVRRRPARRPGASLVWVYVAPPATLTAADIAAGGVLAAERAVHDEIAEELGTRAAEAAREFEVQLVFMTPCGDPYREITRIAGETKADAIMVGASLKAGHRLMGSLGVRLVRAGKWPVTVVP